MGTEPFVAAASTGAGEVAPSLTAIASATVITGSALSVAGAVSGATKPALANAVVAVKSVCSRLLALDGISASSVAPGNKTVPTKPGTDPLFVGAGVSVNGP